MPYLLLLITSIEKLKYFIDEFEREIGEYPKHILITQKFMKLIGQNFMKFEQY